MSTQELAEAVNTWLWDTYRQQENLTYRDVAALERGEVRWPGKRRREAFRAVLGARSNTELGFHINIGPPQAEPVAVILPQVTAPSTIPDVAFASSWPREVDVAASLWADDAGGPGRVRQSRFAASAFIVPTMRWLTAPLDERPIGGGNQPVEDSDVETVRRVTALFRTLDNEYGGGHIRNSVVRYLATEVAPLLRFGRYDQPVGRALFSAAAELTQLAGWASYDAGLHGLGQKYLIQSLRLAMVAADRPLGAEIVAAMSHQAGYLKAPVEAVDLARAAGRIAADAGVAAIVAESAVLEAHGLAIQRDEPASAAALDRAERALDRADRIRDPQWIRYFDEAYLAARFGHCFAALERGDLARRFAARSLEMDTRFVRGRQFNLALLAKAHAQAGDVEQAAVVGMDAAKAAAGLRSARSMDYLRDLADRLAVHVGLPVVNEYVDQVRVLTQTRRPVLVRHGPPGE